MRRRRFLLGGASLPWAAAARAQDHPKRLIGYLTAVAAADGARFNGLILDGLAEEHWTLGRDFTEETRFVGGDRELLRQSALQLVDLAPDILISDATPATLALHQATSTIPIVFTTVSDPIGSGFVDSFAHPGHNITGFTNFEQSLATKWLDLLLEVAPQTRRVGVLFSPATAPAAGQFYLTPLRAAAASRGVEAIPLPLSGPDAIEDAIAGLVGVPNSALVAESDVFTYNNRGRIVAAAAAHRIPAMYPFLDFAIDGGLMSYTVDNDASYRLAGRLAAQILAGANPAEVPVRGPTNFILAINLGAARAQGIEIPAELLATANKVIE